MATPSLYSVVESSSHPNLSSLYARLGLRETRIPSIRKAIAQVKRRAPDYLVAEFFYGYGNNYAGVNISNLDVLLFTMQKYAPGTRVIVLVTPEEARHVPRLNGILPLAAVLTHPVTEDAMERALEARPAPAPG